MSNKDEKRPTQKCMGLLYIKDILLKDHLFFLI